MTVNLLSSVAEFLDSTLSFRADHIYETNIISSVAQSVADGSRTYEKYFWWKVTNPSGKVIGIAMRTAPHGILLSSMSKDAAQDLASEVAKVDDDLPGIGGPIKSVRDFLEGYRANGSAGSKRDIEIAGRELLYILEELISPNIDGAMYTVTGNELPKLLEWLMDFAIEAGILMHGARETAEDGLRRNSYRWWIVDGEIVSLAGYAPLVQVPGGVVARIGPVYTPPEQRRRGYAGVLTAALSRELLNSGAKVMLHTDAKNQTSNGVYQRIGYVKIGENERVSFVKVS